MRDQEGNNSVMFVSGVLELQVWRLSSSQRDRTPSFTRSAPNSTTNPLTATALIYAFGAGITAGAGTRLVLQLLLDIGWV